MKYSDFNFGLPVIQSFEEYEKFKLKLDLLENIAIAIARHHQLPEESLELFSDGTNIVFSYGQHKVIKIYPPFHRHQFQSDRLVMKKIQGKVSVHTPVVEFHGEISDWPYIVMSKQVNIHR